MMLQKSGASVGVVVMVKNNTSQKGASARDQKLRVAFTSHGLQSSINFNSTKIDLLRICAYELVVRRRNSHTPDMIAASKTSLFLGLSVYIVYIFPIEQGSPHATSAALHMDIGLPPGVLSSAAIFRALYSSRLPSLHRLYYGSP